MAGAEGDLGPGTLGAATLTERVNNWLKPEALFFVGVAGGLKDDVALGDVVVATKVYAYSGGKETQSGFLARPDAWNAPFRLEQAAGIALGGGLEWAAELPADHCPGDTVCAPAVHFKPIATGDVLLAAPDSPLAQRLRQHYQDAVAIEMEGSGIAQAAHLTGTLPILIIRGISDNADSDKHHTDADGWQPRAAAHAAAAAHATIARLVPAPGR